jgi:hypothetical protein
MARLPSRSWSIRLARSLRPTGATEKKGLHRRYDYKQDDRPEKHTTDHDGCQRPLHLAVPIPVEMAAGSKPIQADNAVINIGRIRCEAA